MQNTHTIGEPSGGPRDVESPEPSVAEEGGSLVQEPGAATRQEGGREPVAAVEALRRSRRLETVGRLTDDIAHEFNNLLMAMHANLELIEARLPPGDRQGRGLVADALAGAVRGAELTQRLFAFAHEQGLAPAGVRTGARTGAPVAGARGGPTPRASGHAAGAPLDEPGPRCGPARAASPSGSARALTVLVVDDDELVLRGMAGILSRLGHTVLQASSAAAALLVLARQEAVDVVVTDQLMPGMTGVQLAEMIARDRPGLPVVLATGHGDAGTDAVGSVAARLAKPFDRARLEGVLAELEMA